MPRKLWQIKNYFKNAHSLNPELFIRQFYEPPNDTLGANLKGFIVEQEYHWTWDSVTFNS